MIGKILRKAVVVVLSALIISLMCPLSVLAAGSVDQISQSISFEQNYTGTLSDSNNCDYYKFTIPGAGRVTIESKASDSIFYYGLNYGSDGEKVVYCSPGPVPVWNEEEQIYNMNYTFDLTGGTYYLTTTVYGHGVVDYEFTVHFSDYEESVSETYNENNNSFDTASRIYLNSMYSSCLVYNDEIDYFKFIVPVDTTITINAYAYVNSLNYYLYDSNKTSLEYQSSHTSGSGSNVITRDLKKGTYYFVVRGSGNYYGKCVFSIMTNDLPTLNITKQPSDYQAGFGENVSFKVAAQGTGLKYQWQIRKNGVWVNNYFTGADTDKITFQMTEALDGLQFRCFITDSYQQSITSNIVTAELDPIYITAQPENYTGTVGSTAKYTIKAKSKGVGIKYQWQMYTSGKWVDSTFTGAKSATLSVPVTSDINGAKFRCILTASDYSFSTSSIEAYMKITDLITITTQPKDYAGPTGSTATFKVAAQGTGLKYQWQTYSNGAWKNSSLPGYNTATLSVPVISSRNGYKFRCVVTNSANKKATTNTVTLTVTTTAGLSITTQPKDYTGTVGNTATFKVVAQGTGLKYQWQTYSNGTWKNSSLPGYNTATLSVPVVASRNGYKFRCVVTDSSNKTVTSNAVTLTVTAVAGLSITTQPKDYTGAVGSTATFKVVAQGTGLKYQWQTYSNGTWKNSSMTGYNTATLSVPVVASRNGYKFRCVVTDSSNKTVTSNAATLTVASSSGVSITTQPKNYTGAVGSTATFKVVAQGTGLKYQWQTYSNGTWKNSSLSGYNTATLSVPVVASRNGYKFRCVITDASGKQVTSNAVTLKVV